MKDPTSIQLENEENRFYGYEDLDREERRRQAEDAEFDIYQDDCAFEGID